MLTLNQFAIPKAGSLIPSQMDAAARAVLDGLHATIAGCGKSQFVLGGTERVLEYKAVLSAFSEPAGGYTIPVGTLEDAIEAALLDHSAMRRVADVTRSPASKASEMGPDLHIPHADDTGNEGAQIAEGASPGTLDIPFGQTRLTGYKFNSKRVRMPSELLQDATPSFLLWLARTLSARIARIQNRLFTVGTGAAQPSGVVPMARVGVTAASATAIAADELLDLAFSVDPSYREFGRFMCSDNALRHIKKIKDVAGRHIFQQHGPGEMYIDSWPVTINNHMASIASGQRTVLFGDFSRYKIRDIRLVEFRSWTEAPGIIDNDLVEVDAVQRSDGALLDAGTAPIKCLVHP